MEEIYPSSLSYKSQPRKDTALPSEQLPQMFLQYGTWLAGLCECKKEQTPSEFPGSCSGDTHVGADENIQVTACSQCEKLLQSGENKYKK